MVEREVERLGLSVGQKLALHVATLHGTDCLRLYRLASLHRTLADARDVNVRIGRARHGESVVSHIFPDRRARLVISSWRRDLEFSLQMGLGRHGTRTASGGAFR